ncbi:MAG: hypothetical protein ACSHYA_13695 [Opitutaceae bacterium]
MLDIDTFLELPRLYKIEYILLLGALTSQSMCYIHQLLCVNSFNKITSENQLSSFGWFVRAQMICSVTMLACIAPAIIIGAINGAESLITALCAYGAIFTVGKTFARLENTFKDANSADIGIQAQVEVMIDQWNNKIIPTF